MNGRLELFRNMDDYGTPLARPSTLLIDSTQLESGDALDKNFRAMAADEIERFRWEIVKRSGDQKRAENLCDQDLLREAMNTVGKQDRHRRRDPLRGLRLAAVGRMGSATPSLTCSACDAFGTQIHVRASGRAIIAAAILRVER